jgi:hypothetical protein
MATDRFEVTEGELALIDKTIDDLRQRVTDEARVRAQIKGMLETLSMFGPLPSPFYNEALGIPYDSGLRLEAKVDPEDPTKVIFTLKVSDEELTK